MVTLKDSTEVEDPRLDRLIEFDEESREYPIRTLKKGSTEIGEKKPRSYTWRIQAPYLVDQGEEGACVGFSVVNELMARPSEVPFDAQSQADAFAEREVYHTAQHNDPWRGCYLGQQCPIAPGPKMDGTSVLAGVKAAQSLGYFEEYRWSFSIRDLVLGLGRHGPAILGLWWFDTNYKPNDKGRIGPRGRKVGGHAILARAVKIVWREGMTWEEHGWDAVDMDASYVTIRNSWGRWGKKGSGDAEVTLRDLDTWLRDDGEAVFMVKRRTVPQAA